MRLVGGRLLMTLPTLFGVLVVAFLLLNVAPGDPVAAMVGGLWVGLATDGFMDGSFGWGARVSWGRRSNRTEQGPGPE